MILELIGKVLPAAAKLVGIDLGTKATAVVDAITSQAKTDPALQRLLAEQETEALKLALADVEGLRALYAVEAKSSDKFVRRVRPACVWLALVILATNLVLVPLVNVVLGLLGKTAVVFNMPDIPTGAATVIIMLFGLYTGARTTEKLKGVTV